jgi:hypothetical protein
MSLNVFLKMLQYQFFPGLSFYNLDGGPETFATTSGAGSEPENHGSLTLTSCDDESMIGNEYSITHFPTYLGRSDANDIILPESPVSRSHAKIISLKDQIYLQDLGSRFGTFVNGERLRSQPVPLIYGDNIRLGIKATLVFGPPKSGLASTPSQVEGDNQETMIQEINRLPENDTKG